jgi:hypothetical protein
MSRKSTAAPSAALGGGDAKFVFRKRLFKHPREIPTDPVEYGMLYAQAVHSVVRVDEFPVNDKVALQLAGLQAQVLWGDASEANISRYEDVRFVCVCVCVCAGVRFHLNVFLAGMRAPTLHLLTPQVETYLPFRIRGLFPNRSKDEWMRALFTAHREFGSGKSDMQAKVLYLTAVKQYPLYGGTFFDVQFKGFWAFPNR